MTIISYKILSSPGHLIVIGRPIICATCNTSILCLKKWKEAMEYSTLYNLSYKKLSDENTTQRMKTKEYFIYYISILSAKTASAPTDSHLHILKLSSISILTVLALSLYIYKSRAYMSNSFILRKRYIFYRPLYLECLNKILPQYAFNFLSSLYFSIRNLNMSISG